ncbi:hypothetical protein D5086_033957 [Populus alba]|uniref:Uncharacterized protein n=1 Tax=Populus alba TaxID=43335 RepID=A0ACC4AIC3_POPAL
MQRQLNFGNRGIKFGMPRNSPSQSVWPVAEEVCCRTSSGSIHAQEGSPKIQRQLNFGNRGIEVGMPRNSPSQSLSPFEEESECRETHRLKAFLRLRKKYDLEQVAEAYMLKSDHPKFKGNRISATVASKAECRETHRVKAFGRLRKKSDVGQVAEAYMLKRDHPKFKGN